MPNSGILDFPGTQELFELKENNTIYIFTLRFAQSTP